MGIERKEERKLMEKNFNRNQGSESNEDSLQRNQDKRDQETIFSFEHLPDLTKVEPEKRLELFIKKLKLCSYLVPVNEISTSQRSKMKKQTLQELVHFIIKNAMNGKMMSFQLVYQEIFSMVQTNLCYQKCRRNFFDSEELDLEEDEPILNPHWPHLSLVLESGIRFIESPLFNPNLILRSETLDFKLFLLQTLELFDTEDPRERDLLKTLLHRIYLKFVSFRKPIRQEILNILQSFVFEKRPHHGIRELLELMVSIANGLQIPLKQEHQIFLMRGLLPLFKHQTLSNFSLQLTSCITEFLKKDPSLFSTIVTYLFKIWPHTQTSKAVQFILSIQEFLKVIGPEHFMPIQDQFFKQFASWIGHQHFLIAESALALQGDENFVSLISNSIPTLLPIIFEPLYRNLQSHWHPTITDYSYKIINLFLEYDFKLFNQCITQYKLIYKEEPHIFLPPSKIRKTAILPSSRESTGIRKKSLIPMDSTTIQALVDYLPFQDKK